MRGLAMLLLLWIGCDNEYVNQIFGNNENIEAEDRNESDVQEISEDIHDSEDMSKTQETIPNLKKAKRKTNKNANISKKTTTVRKTDPLEGRTLLEICQSHGLSLIKWSYDERKSKKECCSSKMTKEQKDEIFCDMDWPFGDVPRCSVYDKMQQEIWARYGKIFSSTSQQEYFESQSWYQANEHFQENWLSVTAQNNIKQLQNMSRNKVNCLTE